MSQQSWAQAVQMTGREHAMDAATKLLAASALAVAVSSVHGQTQTVTWRLVVFDPSAERAPQAVQAVEQALEAFGRVAKNVGLMPSPLPLLPGNVGYRTFQMGPFSQRVMTCDEAYARIDNGSAVGNRLGTVSESYMGCVFLSGAGTRMVLTGERSKDGNSIGGFIVNKMAQAIQGTDEERARKLSEDALAAMRKVLPELLVEQIELPGGGVQRPDGAQVETLLAEAKRRAQPPAQAVAVQAPAAVIATAPAADAAPAPSAPTSSAAAAPGSVAAAIEARKHLASMGLTYHSLDVFHDAIRRKDRIAVQLFVDAAGVDLKAPGKGDLDALALARQVADPSVLAILERAKQN